MTERASHIFYTILFGSFSLYLMSIPLWLSFQYNFEFYFLFLISAITLFLTYKSYTQIKSSRTIVKSYDIVIAYTSIIYTENSNKLDLQVDRTIEPGEKDYIYVPIKDKWDQKFEWARGRREEIIAKILKLLPDSNKYEIHEY